MRTLCWALICVALFAVHEVWAAKSTKIVTRGDDYTKLVADVKEAVAHDLRDPDSAKFRDVRVTLRINMNTHQPFQKDAINPMTNTPYGVNVCGEVNAKNAYGGYVGFKRFLAIRSPDDDSKIDVHMEGDPIFGQFVTQQCGGQEVVIKKF